MAVAPLLAALPEDAISRHKRAIEAWNRAGGIPIYEADRMCIRYGLHPFAVFGTAWHGDLWESKF